jgi:hypothetical protein
MKRLLLLMTLAALVACAPKNIRVRCDAHLQPINPPSSTVERGARKSGPPAPRVVASGATP